MALRFIANKMKLLLLTILGLLRQAFCCFRKRRRSSDTPLPLTTVGVNSVSVPDTQDTKVEEISWDSWDGQVVTVVTDKSMTTVQQQIQHYRNSRQKTQEPPEPEKDYFEAMVPKIGTTKKVIIKNTQDSDNVGSSSTAGVSSRLAFTPQARPIGNSELSVWDESAGWEENTEDLDADAAIREQKQLAHERRVQKQLRRKQERDMQKMGKESGLGTKLR